MLTTGVAAFGLNNADDGGSGLSDHGSHSKISHEKKSVNSDKNKDSDESSGDITLDLTMQQNVNNYLFNIPTAFILDVDEYNENTFTYNKIYLPDSDEYDWEVDLEILEFDLANGRDLTQEDVESYVNESFEQTTINGIDGYYYQDDEGWEIFVFGSGNELITLQVYGISLEVVLDDFTQEPLVGDLEPEEETTDDSSYDDSTYDTLLMMILVMTILIMMTLLMMILVMTIHITMKMKIINLNFSFLDMYLIIFFFFNCS